MTEKRCPSFGWSCFRNASISAGTVLQWWFNKNREVLCFHQKPRALPPFIFTRFACGLNGQVKPAQPRGGNKTALRKRLVNDAFLRLRDGLAPAEAQASGATGGRRDTRPPLRREPPAPPSPGPSVPLRGLPGLHERCALPAPPLALPAALGALAAPRSAPRRSSASAR